MRELDDVDRRVPVGVTHRRQKVAARVGEVPIGTALMRVLYNAINILGIPTHLEFAIIGAVILAGVVADELVKRFAARRRAARELAEE